MSSKLSKSTISISFDILNSFRGINSCCSSIALINSADEYSSLLTPPFSVRLTLLVFLEFAANAAAGKRPSPAQTFIIIKVVVVSLKYYHSIVEANNLSLLRCLLLVS